jgi:hypothetical protein
MKRNSTTVFISSPNATTPIPWVSNAPDFTGITEPTLSVLRTAYESQKGSIEVIPDPVPFVETLKPNWQGALDDMDLPPIGNGLFAVGLMADRNLFLDLYQLLLRLEDNKALANDTVKEWRTFQFLFSMAMTVYSPAQIEAINQVLANNNIPISV